MSKKQPVMSHDPLAGLGEDAEQRPQAKSTAPVETAQVTGENVDEPGAVEGAAQLMLESSLTIGDVGELHELILRNVRTMTPLIFDASEVESVDTAGLQLLATAFKAASEKGLEVGLTGASNTFVEAVSLIGLGSLFDTDQEDRAA